MLGWLWEVCSVAGRELRLKVTRSWGAQPGAGGDDRRGSVVDGIDDLGVVDPLEVDRGDPEMGMPELALDDHHRDPLVRQLDSVGMAQLMRRQAAADPRPGAGAPQLSADRCR